RRPPRRAQHPGRGRHAVRRAGRGVHPAGDGPHLARLRRGRSRLACLTFALLRLPRGRRQNAPVRLIASLAAAVIAIVAAAAANIASLRSWTASNDLVTHAYAVREALDRALLMAANAETGERGYLLT